MTSTFMTRLQPLLVQAFWALIFVVLPLWFEPLTFSLGLPAQWSMLMPKATVLGLAWAVGLIAVMLTYQDYTLTCAQYWQCGTGHLHSARFLLWHCF